MKPARRIIHWIYYQGKYIGADYTGYAVAELYDFRATRKSMLK